MIDLSPFAPLATVIISFCAVFTALGFMFNILLRPVKDSQVLLANNQARIEAEQKDIKACLADNQARMELEQKDIKALIQKEKERNDEFQKKVIGILEEKLKPLKSL